MTLRPLPSFAAVVFGLALLTVPASTQSRAAEIQIPANPAVETISFEGLSAEQQGVILRRISLRAGDTLSAEARQRVAGELSAIGRELGKTLTFSYKRGTKFTSVKFVISDGC